LDNILYSLINEKGRIKMKTRISQNYFTGTLTIRSDNWDSIFIEVEHYESEGYYVSKRLYGGIFAKCNIKMRKAKSGLEKFMEKE